MGKKKRTGGEPGDNRNKVAGKERIRGRDAFSFLNTRFDTLDRRLVKRHILILIGISLITKLLVFFLTQAVFHSFIDLFDFGIYFQNGLNVANGQIPYINFQVDYPVLFFIPTMLASIPAFLTMNFFAFVFSFQILMTLCDIIIVLCIYLICLKISDEKTAFFAGFLYATAFSTTYFVLTKYDAFPTLLFMVAILFTVYGMNTKGYISASAGFFAKIFPIIAFPFMILYKAKTSSIKQEAISAGKIFALFVLVLFVPFALFNPAVIQTYLFTTGGTVGVYVNTATYTLYTFFHDIIHLGITTAMVSALMYGIMGIILLLLLYLAYKDPEQNPRTFLKYVLFAIFCVIFFTKFHSPQYLVWFTPLVCLFMADSLHKMAVFYLAQALAYIEFPLMFNTYYVNLKYLNPVGSAGWYLTLVFFTLESAIFLLLIYLAVRPPEGVVQKLKLYYQR